MSQINYYNFNSKIEKETKNIKNNSVIIEEKDLLNSDYQNTNQEEAKKDLDGSFTYSNTSPRSLYSKMKKSTQNIRRKMYTSNGTLNQSHSLIENESMWMNKDDNLLNQTQNQYQDVELDFENCDSLKEPHPKVNALRR